MAAKALRIVTQDRQPDPMRFNFTKTSLDRLQAGERRRDVYDAKTAGLSLRVSPTGHKAFYFARRINGRYRRIKIGVFPGVTVEQARREAAKLIGQVASGKDPAADRRAKREQMTLGELWTIYRDGHAKARCTERTLRTEKYLYEKRLKKWAGHKLAAITPDQVKTLHARIGKDSKTSANRAVQLLRRLFRYASRHYSYEGRMPTTSVELFREQARERFLLPEEMPGFLKACDAEGQPWSDFFKLCLLTAARRSNVQAMEWRHVDFKAKTWTIPAEQAKAGRAITIPLSGDALGILQRRRNDQSESGYVFPPLRDKGETLHLSQPQRPFKRICKRAGIDDLTIHDLRRTAGSWMAAAGASLPQIGKALGHADPRSTQIYARLNTDAVRSQLEAMGTAMTAEPVEDTEQTDTPADPAANE